MDTVQTFGKFIEKLRGKLSLRDAAERSGLSHTYIRDLELGINRKTKAPIIPTPETIKRLARAYNYSYEELLMIAGIIDDTTKKELIEEQKLKIVEDILSLPENERKLVEDMISTLKNKNN